jgi:hypothetical protein
MRIEHPAPKGITPSLYLGIEGWRLYLPGSWVKAFHPVPSAVGTGEYPSLFEVTVIEMPYIGTEEYPVVQSLIFPESARKGITGYREYREFHTVTFLLGGTLGVNPSVHTRNM